MAAFDSAAFSTDAFSSDAFDFGAAAGDSGSNGLRRRRRSRWYILIPFFLILTL